MGFGDHSLSELPMTQTGTSATRGDLARYFLRLGALGVGVRSRSWGTCTGRKMS
jgi:hypothetical protein